MLQENQVRYNLWLQLADKLDYKEFCQRCEAEGIIPMGATDFAFKVGRLLVSQKLYPDMTPTDAYMHIANEYPPGDIRPVALAPAVATAGGCCGQTVPEVSRGLGDTVAKITHATGLDQLAVLYTKITGKPCGCADRQEALNKLIPYGITEE